MLPYSESENFHSGQIDLNQSKLNLSDLLNLTLVIPVFISKF